MGIFDFLKKAFGEEKEVKKIKLEELGDWVDSLSSDALKNVEANLTEIKKNINEEKKKLIENINVLENAELKNKDIPDRMVHIMDGNRKIYLYRMKVFMKEIAVPEKFEELLDFSDLFDKKMDEFSKDIAKAHNVMSEFFVKEAGAISVNVKKIDELVKKVKKIIESSGVRRFSELKGKVDKVEEKVNHKREIEDEITLNKKMLSDAERAIKEKEKDVKEIELGDEYQKFLQLVDEKKVFEGEIKKLESGVKHFFSEIESGLKRYANLNKNDELAKKYLENALSALGDDKELEIVNIGKKVKAYISEGSIELKDKKKESVLAGLEKINGDYFKKFLTQRDELTKKLDNLSEKIKNAGVVSKVERAREELENVRGGVEAKKKGIEKLEKEFGEIDVSALKWRLEKEFEGIGEMIKVI